MDLSGLPKVPIAVRSVSARYEQWPGRWGMDILPRPVVGNAPLPLVDRTRALFSAGAAALTTGGLLCGRGPAGNCIQKAHGTQNT